jgi:hypothetical protein
MRTAVLFLGLLSCMAVQADVYRVTDKDGNTVFSDRPAPGSEKIKTSPPNAIAGPRLPPIGDSSSRPAVKLSPGYASIKITQPANDETVRANDGNVSVQVAVQPGITPGDVLTLTLDGAKVGEGSQTSFALTNVDRGTHTLKAIIRNPNGKIVGQSAGSFFTLQRFSLLQPGAQQQSQRQGQTPAGPVGLPPANLPPAQQSVTTGGAASPAAQQPVTTGGAALPSAQQPVSSPAGAASLPAPQAIPGR